MYVCVCVWFVCGRTPLHRTGRDGGPASQGCDQVFSQCRGFFVVICGEDGPAAGFCSLDVPIFRLPLRPTRPSRP